MDKDMAGQLHKIFEESQKIVEASIGTMNEFSEIADATEKEFYVVMRDFFMQQKQKEAIQKGVY